MQTVTFEISEQLQGLLASQGLKQDAYGQFIEQLFHAYADDLLTGQAAIGARSEGYIGEDASAQLLQDMLNARD